MGKPVFLIAPHKITGLALDIARLLAEGAPSEADLAAAPTLEHWSLGRPRAFGLTGQVLGHPKIDDGPIFTSAAAIIDSDRKWVRTMSRYYRLRAEAK